MGLIGTKSVAQGALSLDKQYLALGQGRVILNYQWTVPQLASVELAPVELEEALAVDRQRRQQCNNHLPRPGI